MRQSLSAAIAALVFAMVAAIPHIAPAQSDLLEIDRDQPVALVADNIDYDNRTGDLTATGNVEVYYGERTLTADKLIYNENTERIVAEGNLVLRDGSGATLFADFADLDAELKDGLVRGAKTVLGATAKLSAVEGRRFEDRYNALSKAVYSPCKVCDADPTPLWRIRARKVIHDQDEKVIHYENAWFDVYGVPIFWAPYFSHPDPTVDRSSGFLTPDFRQSSNYGYATKVPYYWVIDEQSDLTITPFITSNDGLIGEFHYRRAFDSGFMSVAGSLTHSDFVGDDDFHGHLDTSARFNLLDKMYWGWDVKFASDDAYLRYFDFSNEDRLTSELYMERYGPKWFVDVRAVRFQSLRDDEPAGQIPIALPLIEARYETEDPWLEGDLGFFASSQALIRNNGDDTSRITFGLDWEREEILPFGLALRGFTEVRGDVFLNSNDMSGDDVTSFRLAPLAGVEARFPLIAEEGDGTVNIFEPIVQAIVAPYGGNDPDIPNEDSLIAEFDETNLFESSHFSGLDGFEEGPRLNVGLRYERVTAMGVRLDGTIGRVFRLRDADEFSSGSGLSESISDWVGGWSASYDPYVTVTQRVRFTEDFKVTRNLVSARTTFGPLTLAGEYIFLESDPEIGADRDREEISANANLRLDENWSINALMRRDLEVGEFVALGGGIRFQNECCAVNAFIRRRFTDSDDVPAATSFGIQVELFTLGAAGGGFLGNER